MGVALVRVQGTVELETCVRNGREREDGERTWLREVRGSLLTA